MSTFKGKLNEPDLNFISIDYFEPEVHKCEIFFLSHYHGDHMKGLNCRMMQSTNGRNKFLYSSPITAHFLRQDFDFPSEYIIEIPDYQHIEVHNEDRTVTVMVKSLPAQHCLGSSMFYFELDSKRILYTGDIRLSSEDMKNILGKAGITRVDDVYLDTTFAIPISRQMRDFPSREQSEEVVIEFMREFLTIKPTGTVVIDFPSRFSMENLFKKINQTFRKRVMLHTNEIKFYRNNDNLEELRDIRECISEFVENSDNEAGVIHGCLCFSKGFRCCPLKREIKYGNSANIHVIKLSAWSFVHCESTRVKTHKQYHVPYETLTTRDYEGDLVNTKIFHSSHCSWQELRDILDFLKPKLVFWNVQPKNNGENSVII